jgi:hypothetical protein
MKQSSVFIFFVGLSLVLFNLATTTIAQAKGGITISSEQIDSVTIKLQLKLLLTEEQAAKVRSILNASIPKKYVSEQREELLTMINKQVEVILTNKQKAKFNILKSNWLDEIIGTPQ